MPCNICFIITHIDVHLHRMHTDTCVHTMRNQICCHKPQQVALRPTNGACILKSQARFVGDVAGFRLSNGASSLGQQRTQFQGSSPSPHTPW